MPAAAGQVAPWRPDLAEDPWANRAEEGRRSERSGGFPAPGPLGSSAQARQSCDNRHLRPKRFVRGVGGALQLQGTDGSGAGKQPPFPLSPLPAGSWDRGAPGPDAGARAWTASPCSAAARGDPAARWG